MPNEEVVTITILIGQPDEGPYLAEGIKVIHEQSEEPVTLPDGVCLPDHYDHLEVQARVIKNGANAYRHFAVRPRSLARIIKNRTIRRRFLAACRDKKIEAVVFERYQVLPNS